MRALGLSAALLAAACGGADTAVDSPTSAEPARPKDAAAIAKRMIAGKVSGMIYVDRVRGHEAAPRVLELGPVRELLDGTGLDPLRDIERAFVTGPSASSQRAVLFAEHNLPEGRSTEMVQNLVRESSPPGEVIEGPPNWRVRVHKKGRSGVVGLIPPRFLVMVPDDLADSIDAFASTGGLPGPLGDEAAHVFVEDPSDTLRARGAPRVPDSIAAIDAKAYLRSDGGLTLRAVGKSTPDQAHDDARTLTRSIDDATSVGIGPFRIRAFRPIVFRASDGLVKSDVELSRSELDQVVGLLGAAIR